MMSDLDDTFDSLTLNAGSVDVIGTASTMLSHVYVEWWWLFLPAMLNLLTAIFLFLTMWSTRVDQLPSWNTPLIAIDYHGLESAVQGDIDRPVARVSAMDHDAEKINVRLRNAARTEEIMFVKGVLNGGRNLGKIQLGETNVESTSF